jgi:hypothetical protein
MNMDASGIDQMSDDVLEQRLRLTLYRFDCPDAQTLGEYELDMLDPVERTRIAAHAVDCDECTAELQELRTFMAKPTGVSEPVLQRARRIVAKLFTPPQAGLAYGGLRGDDDAATRVYEAGDVTITLGPGSTSGSVLGLVVAGDTPPASLEARAVRLLNPVGPPASAKLDDLGNFQFDHVAAGIYSLEVDLPVGVVVIEELPVK